MRIRLFTFALLPLCLAMAMGLLVANAGTGHAQEPFVDLAVTAERDGALPRVYVTNHGSQTAHGVRVEIEHPGWTVNRTQSAPDVGTFHYPADNPSKFIWEIGTLPGGETVSDRIVDPAGFHSVPGRGGSNQPGVFARYLVTVTHDFPAEADFHLHNNYTEFVMARFLRDDEIASDALFSAEAEVISDVASLQSGDDVVFEITAAYRKKVGNIADDFAVSGDSIVNIQLPPSLAYKGHSVAWTLDGPVVTEYVHGGGGGADQWKIGDVVTRKLFTYTLTLTATLTSDDVTEEQCLTAEISGTPEEISQADRLDNIAVSCVYLQPTDASVPTIISDGFVSLITWYDCVGDATFPCDSADSLELVALRDTLASDTISADRAWQWSDPVIHIREPDGRTLNVDGDQVWSTGMSHFGNLPPSIGTGRPGRPGVTTVVRTDHLDLETAIDADFWGRPDDTYPTWERGEIKVEVSGPGEVSSWYNNQGVIAASYGSATNGVMYDSYAGDTDVWLGNTADVGWAAPVYWEFSELGTYKLTVTIGTEYDADGADTGADPVSYSDTETYTFYVGPIADLAVASAWQTAQGVTVSVVNNGPDPSPGARVVLGDTGESCAIGPLVPISETAVCTITGAQVAGESATVTVVDDVRFEACGEGHGHGHEPYIDATEAECVTDPDAKWLSVDMYDPNPNNDTRGITDAPPVPASAGVQRASMVIQSHRVNWAPVEELNGWPVSHYEVERLDPENGRWKAVGLVSEPPYDDTDEERGSSPRYRVRVVNTRGQWGPWAETGVSSASSLPRLTLSLDPATIKEPDIDSPGAVSTATVTATLNKASGQDVPITVSAELASGNDTEDQPSFTLSDNRQLMIPAGMLESTGAVTISANADDDGLNEQVRVSAVAAYVQRNIPAVTLTIQDDDAPRLVLSAETVAVTENAATTYEVELTAQPSADVYVRLTRSNNHVTMDTNTGESGLQNTLVFTPDNWATAQTVTVGGAEDEDAGDETATITHRIVSHQSAREYRSAADAIVTVNVADNDTGRIGVSVDPVDLAVTEGQGGKTYTVKLGTQPAGSVVITATVADDDGGDTDVRVSLPTITLNANNWRAGRTVTVSAAHDSDGDADRATITHAIDEGRTTAAEYHRQDVLPVSVAVSDDDAPGVQVSPETLRIAEGRRGSYNVRLNTAPSGDVTVRVSSDNRDVSADPASLTFTSDDWSRAQRVTVNAGRDDDAADDTAMLTHAVTSSDSAYANIASSPSVAVTVTDPDRPGVTVGPLSPTPVNEKGRRTEMIDENEESETYQRTIGYKDIEEAHPSFYTVRLDTKPTGNVVIDLKSDNDKVKLYPQSLTFTPDNWTRTVMVEGVRDDDKDDEKATITHEVNAGASADEYDTVSVASLNVTVDDNDDPGVTLLVSKLLELSAGESATYWVVLDSQPDGVVVVGVESSNPDKVKVSVEGEESEAPFLWFSGIQIANGRTHPDWDEPQAITVTVEEGAAGETVTLIHKLALVNAAQWDVPEGAEVGRVIVTVRDDDE